MTTGASMRWSKVRMVPGRSCFTCAGLSEIEPTGMRMETGESLWEGSKGSSWEPACGAIAGSTGSWKVCQSTKAKGVDGVVSAGISMAEERSVGGRVAAAAVGGANVGRGDKLFPVFLEGRPARRCDMTTILGTTRLGAAGPNPEAAR